MNAARQIDETTPVTTRIGFLVPSTALAQVDSEVADQCKDARDFYGCVRAFTAPARLDDIAPLAGVMGQVAAGLISTRRPQCKDVCEHGPAGLVEGILRGVLR